MSKKVAVILSGCGHLDGAEIRESVMSLLALSQRGADVTIFAPDQDQHHVINHLDQSQQDEVRNILVESARLARGEVLNVNLCEADNFDALLLPGGFGVAKNLCSFAFDGPDCEVNEQVQKVMRDFNNQKKPIGAICIAPALVAKILGEKKVVLTIGKHPETAKAIEATGARHQNCAVDEIVVDKENKIVTTPAYMFDNAEMKDIFQGISALVDEVLAQA